MRRRALLLLSVAGCSGPARADISAIVRGEVAGMVARSRNVRCERQRDVATVRWICVQRFPRHPDHFSGVTIEMKPAIGKVDAAPHLVGMSFGPGGGGASMAGRTRDGRYDVLAGDVGTGLSDGDEPTLPSSKRLIERVLAAYDRAAQRGR